VRKKMVSQQVASLDSFLVVVRGGSKREILPDFNIHTHDKHGPHCINFVVESRIPPMDNDEERRFVEWFRFDTKERKCWIWVYQLNDPESFKKLQDRWMMSTGYRNALSRVTMFIPDAKITLTTNGTPYGHLWDGYLDLKFIAKSYTVECVILE
jgi:hypothetical protein